MSLHALHHITADSPEIAALLSLIRDAFAFMEGRITPPSSAQNLTEERLRDQCRTSEVWAIGAPPLACIVLSERDNALYIGKLAVARHARHKGHARRLVAQAASRSETLGKTCLLLDVRIELTENHAAFRKMGFVQTGTGTHDGFAQPTFLTMRKPL